MGLHTYLYEYLSLLLSCPCTHTRTRSAKPEAEAIAVMDEFKKLYPNVRLAPQLCSLSDAVKKNMEFQVDPTP